jgi:hypothetical protein
MDDDYEGQRHYRRRHPSPTGRDHWGRPVPDLREWPPIKCSDVLWPSRRVWAQTPHIAGPEGFAVGRVRCFPGPHQAGPSFPGRQPPPLGHPQAGDSARHRPSFSPYGSVASVNVPDFMGAGAVSVNVLDVVVFSPSRARPVPEAEIQVAPPEVRTFPVTVAPPFWE